MLPLLLLCRQVANTLAKEVLTAPGQEVTVVATNQVGWQQLVTASTAQLTRLQQRS
jgi:hypothetical protein